jgi:hypothetical protein
MGVLNAFTYPTTRGGFTIFNCNPSMLLQLALSEEDDIERTTSNFCSNARILHLRLAFLSIE